MLSPAAIVEEFGEQWNRSDLRRVMPEPGVVPNGPLVELTSIGVHKKHQDQGYANQALRMLTALCDANAMTIKLVARPLESNLLPGCPATLSTEQLVAWYQKHGFVETSGAGDDTREMIRAPRMLSRASTVIVESLQEAAQARIQECAPRAVAEFKTSVRPIYGLLDGRRLTHSGSCLLLEIDGKRVVSTAAHIADDLALTPLFVGGLVGTHPVQLAGRFRATTPPGGDRRLDHLDCAYCEISANDTAALGPVEFLSESRMSHNRVPSERRVYTAFGYAVSRNKKSIDHRTRSITNRLSMYTGHVVEVPALAAKLPRSGEGHLLVNFERHAHTANGERVNAFGPRGLSGGALLDLGDFTSPAIYAPDSQHTATLSGMLIEHWDEHHVMVAVKIGAIVEGIRQDLTRH
jgi:hypothetical protein